MPLVTVVIPTHNPGDFLDRSLGSVLTQTMTDLECVVVDDGSTEEVSSLAVLTDRRVRYVRQENRGVAVARNVGVACADSRYVAFLDQDDEWLPRKLDQQLASLERNPEASFSHTPFIWELASGSRASAPQAVTYATSLAGRGGHVCLSSVLVEREKHDAVGGHDPLLTQQQDWAFVLSLLSVFGDPVTTADPAVRYYVHEQNASRDYLTAAREAAIVLDLHEARAASRGDAAIILAVRSGRRVTRDLHGHQAVDQLRASVRNGDWGGAGSHLRAAADLAPTVVARSAAVHIRTRASALYRRSRDRDRGRPAATA